MEDAALGLSEARMTASRSTTGGVPGQPEIAPTANVNKTETKGLRATATS
jgi:hypothetical protein